MKEVDATAPSKGALLWRWQLRTFACIYISYASYLFTRKSFPYVVPALLQDPEFAHISKQQIGTAGTMLGLTYAIGKLALGGILADRVSPRYAIFFGLSACAFLNIWMSQSLSIEVLTLLWGINGLFQGGAWGPCATLLLAWYPQKTRGTWWGFVATSQSVGAGLVAILCSYYSELYGWRMGMFVPGVIAFIVGVIALIGIRTSPTDIGLPPVDASQSLYGGQKKYKAQISFKDAVKLTTLDPALFSLGVGTCCVYVVRQGISDWMPLYLVETKQFSMAQAGSCIAWFEAGGFLGASMAGFVSDRFFSGIRGRPSVILSIIIVFILPCIVPTTSAVFMSLLFFVAGFVVYGPQMLMGLHVAEVADKRVSATAQGVAGVWAGVGSMIAGYPLGRVVNTGDWNRFFMVLLVTTFIMIGVLAPFLRPNAFQRKPIRRSSKPKNPLPVSNPPSPPGSLTPTPPLARHFNPIFTTTSPYVQSAQQKAPILRTAQKESQVYTPPTSTLHSTLTSKT